MNEALAVNEARERRVIHWIVRSAQVLLAAALLVYPADWLIWKAQTLFGGGMGSVEVSHVTIADLKGNKEAYYPDGLNTIACSRSLFPQGGSSACWWLRRHPEIVEHY
ncbi:MAG TPA: hypothetical protein VMD97_03800 [Candidatus Aquilonibacter sp.]|nr:hypothetical protein [Candidatus Aquilonibacter sp.]